MDGWKYRMHVRGRCYVLHMFPRKIPRLRNEWQSVADKPLKDELAGNRLLKPKHSIARGKAPMPVIPFLRFFSFFSLLVIIKYIKPPMLNAEQNMQKCHTFACLYMKKHYRILNIVRCDDDLSFIRNKKLLHYLCLLLTNIKTNFETLK